MMTLFSFKIDVGCEILFVSELVGYWNNLVTIKK